MPKSPAFQFYAADWLADENVELMTLEEEGAYIRALSYCWREGSLPADKEKLSRLLKGCSMQTLTTVQGCFVVGSNDGSRLVHPRLEIERQKQAKWRDKSAAAGRTSGKVRREKKLHAEPTFVNGSTNLEPTYEPNANSSSSSSSSINTKTKATPKAAPSSFALPSWIPESTWRDFEEMRKRIRAPMTDRARSGIVADLDRLRGQGHSPEAVLAQSITHAWRGVFGIRSSDAGRHGRDSPRNPSGAGTPETFAALEAQRAREDRHNYEVWASMPEQYRKRSPWIGEVPA